jgi:hypothetical protein
VPVFKKIKENVFGDLENTCLNIQKYTSFWGFAPWTPTRI